MEATFEYQLNDLDWFALDQEGRVGHFTTAGLLPLPSRVAKRTEDLECLVRHFYSLKRSTEAIVDPTAKANAGMDDCGDASLQWFLRDAREMACRGLYSYDVFKRGPSAAQYFRVTSPLTPLNLEQLPLEIRRLLKDVAFDAVNFSRDTLVSF